MRTHRHLLIGQPAGPLMQIYKSPNEDILFQLQAFDYEGKVQSIESFEDFDLVSQKRC